MPYRIPIHHDPVIADGKKYDLSHLDAFTTTIVGKGLDKGTNLGFLVAFSNHVVTTRTINGDTPHVADHNGTGRSFDPERYAMSLRLGAAVQKKITANELAFVSRSYSDVSNLVFVETDNGRTWSIVFCLLPYPRWRNAVRFTVLSCHPRVINPVKVSRQHLSVFGRRCLVEQVRQP